MNIELLDFSSDKHMALVETWIRQPHVSRLWGDFERKPWELGRRDADTQAIVAVDGKPVGFAGRRLRGKNYPRLSFPICPATWSMLDIMIGGLDALGKGVGRNSLALSLRQAEKPGGPLAGLAGTVANGRAMGA